MARSPQTALFSRNIPGGINVFSDLLKHGTGNIYWVDSVNGATTNSGTSPTDALAGLDAAINKTTASQGDLVVCMEGHAETIATAAAIDLDVAGVRVIGLGDGASRPTFTLSATGSTFEIAGASVTIENLLFTTSDAATIIVDVNAADVTIRGCDFLMETGVTAIDINGGSANACDRARVLNCLFDASTDGPDTAIGLDEVADNVIIDGCYAFGLYDDACIHNVTGKVLTNLRISNNLLINTTAASHSIELVSACTGIIVNNMSGSPLDDVTPTGIDGGACTKLQNFGSDNTDDTSGVLSPVALS
jgi:hypothetical protein|tara:strand:- start:7333 stop:8247 length:915 start_codon:yes stop_codon:yes gene_type:complete